jgi:SH3 domain protein
LKLSLTVPSILLLAVLCGLAQAETRYVTDQLTITLRTGQGSGYRVLQSLPSGTTVEVLSENEETGYSHVRAPDGTEGYALTQYLTTEQPAQVELARVKKELEQLRDQPEEDAEEELTKLRSEYQALKLRYDTLEFENVQLSQRMESVKENATNVVSLMDERDEALQQINRLTTELDELRVRNLELENHSDKKWFMAGAGVLILGVVVGLILPRVGIRRRSGWGSGDFSL